MDSAFEDVAGAVDEIIKELKGKIKEASDHAGVIESLRQFIAAVDWTVTLFSGSFMFT